MALATADLAFSSCVQPVNSLGAILSPEKSRTLMHRTIHSKVVDEKPATTPSNSGDFYHHVTPVTTHPNPRYSQPPLPLPFININILKGSRAVNSGDESSGAVFSPCMSYRYILTRNIQPALCAPCIPVCFLMLNPSTADAEKLDPTIRRCKRFAERWGGDRMIVVNIFAFRATDPAAMKKQIDPVGAENRKWVEHAVATTLQQNGIVVAAWGGHGTHRGHDAEVRGWLRAMSADVHCLGTTESNHQPRHPLFVPRLAEPVPFDLNR